MAPTSQYEVYFGTAWLGTIEACDDRHASEVAVRTFGRHLADLLDIRPRRRSSGSTAA